MTRYEKQIIMNALEHYAKNAETEKERKEAEVMCIWWETYILDLQPGNTINDVNVETATNGLVNAMKAFDKERKI